MPTDGWKNDKLLLLVVLCGIAVILLLVVLTISILLVDEQRKKFRRLSLTDSMTGLLNRNGFNLQMEEYLEGMATLGYTAAEAIALLQGKETQHG